MGFKSRTIKKCSSCKGAGEYTTSAGRCYSCHTDRCGNQAHCSCECHRETKTVDCTWCDKTGYEPIRVKCKTCGGNGEKQFKGFFAAQCAHCVDGKRTYFIRGDGTRYYYSSE